MENSIVCLFIVLSYRRQKRPPFPTTLITNTSTRLKTTQDNGDHTVGESGLKLDYIAYKSYISVMQ